jgi:hypothetical protein
LRFLTTLATTPALSSTASVVAAAASPEAAVALALVEPFSAFLYFKKLSNRLTSSLWGLHPQAPAWEKAETSQSYSVF